MKGKKLFGIILALVMASSFSVATLSGCTPTVPEDPPFERPADMEGIALQSNSVYYDGEVHSLTVTGAPEGATISYTYNGQIVNGVSAIGTYTVVASVSAEGYQDKTLTAILMIIQPSVMTSATMSGKSVVYNGQKHSLKVTGIPSGAEVTYKYNGESVDGVTDIGVYSVEATIKAYGYETKVLTATLTIVEPEQITGVSLSDSSVVYDGQKHSIKVEGTLPQNATVTYTYNGRETDGAISVGTYVVVAVVKVSGYKDLTLTATLTISEPTEIGGVSLSSDSVEYDGQKHSLEVVGLPQNATVSYSYNGVVTDGVAQVGVYVVVAVIKVDGFKDKTLTATLEIYEPVPEELLEITGVSLTSDSVEYDGEVHSLTVVGAPSGATVTYTYNNQTLSGVSAVGSYVVVAVISADGYKNKTLTATLEITLPKLSQVEGLALEDASFFYDGSKRSLSVVGAPIGSTIEYTYNGESVDGVTEPNTYVVVAVVSNPLYESTTLTATLEIKALQEMGATLESKIVDYDGEIKSLTVKDAPQGATVTYTYNGLAQNGVVMEGVYEVVATISGEGYKTKTLTATLTIVGILEYNSSNLGQSSAPSLNIATTALTNIPLPEDAFSAKDLEASHTPVSPVIIRLTASGAVSDGGTAKVSGSVVTITAPGTYYVRGTKSLVSRAQIVVNETTKADNVVIVFENANLANDGKAPLYIKKAKKVFLWLTGDNSLTSTGTFPETDEDGVDGALFAKDNITIKGEGSLTVTSTKKGIVAKDNLRITGGTVTVTSKARCVDANDCFSITNASVTLASSNNDGVTVENLEDPTKGYFFMNSGTLNVNAKKDGIQASGAIEILGGTINISAGGGHEVVSDPALTSAKGLKGDGCIYISGGTINIDASEDAISSALPAEIVGGTLTLASNKDAIDVDKSLIINGATIKITDCADGIKAESVTVKNGTIDIRATKDGIKAEEEVGDTVVEGTTTVSDDSVSFINIEGGKITLIADDNAFDSKGNLIISDGVVCAHAGGENGKVFNYNGKALVSGGKVLAFESKAKSVNITHTTVKNLVLDISTANKEGDKVVLKKNNETVFETQLKYITDRIIITGEFEAGEYDLIIGNNRAKINL